MTRTLAAIALAALAVGCNSSMRNLRTQAAWDLQCPEHEVHAQFLDSRHAGAQGCGRRVKYRKVGQTPFTTWELDD